jgi:hypothetical protein
LLQLIDQIEKRVDAFSGFDVFTIDKTVVKTFGVLVKNGFGLRFCPGLV